MTRGQQRQLGAVEAEVVTSVPAVVTAWPSTVAEFDGWSAAELEGWLKDHATATRLAVGLALWVLRERTKKEEYGKIVKEVAAGYEVAETTLWRWREKAEEHFGLTPAKGSQLSHSANDDDAGLHGCNPGDTPPELTTGVVSGDEEPLDAPMSAPETPAPPPEAPAPEEVPAPIEEAPKQDSPKPDAAKPDAAVVSAVRVLLLPRTVAELKASIRPVHLRDLVDRLAAADGRTAILHAEAKELEKLRAAAIAGPTKPAAPRVVGRPRPVRETPKPSECIHPPNQVRDGFCFGCGKEGVKPGGRRSAS